MLLHKRSNKKEMIHLKINTINNSTNTLENSILPSHDNIFNIASINTNNSFKKNLHNYISFLMIHNIDILLVQEPGPFMNPTDTQDNNLDNNTNFHLSQINYISYSNW